MPNPYGNIAGASAVDDPNWRENLMAMVETTEANAARTKAGVRRSRITASCDWQFEALLNSAARRRNIVVTGYIRRAVAAFIAADLGIEIAEVLRYAPAPNKFGTRVVAEASQDDGTGYGTWKAQG